jgi:hypothetical protein
MKSTDLIDFMDIHVFARTLPIASSPLLYVHQRLTASGLRSGKAQLCIHFSFWAGKRAKAGDYFALFPIRSTCTVMLSGPPPAPAAQVAQPAIERKPEVNVGL